MKATSHLLLALFLSVAPSCDEAAQGERKGELAQQQEVPPNTILEWLDSIVIKKVDLRGETVEEALDYAWYCTKAHAQETDGIPLGISIISTWGRRADETIEDAGIGLDSRPHSKMDFVGENVPFFHLLWEIAQKAEVDAYLTSVGIFLIPEGEAPFPNCKAEEGEIWKVIRRAPVR